MGYGQKQATYYGRGFDRKVWRCESMKAWAESKKPDISWHFAIASFGSISIEGCVLRAALLHVILCAGSRSIPDWIPWNLHEAQEAESIAHSNLSSALPFKKSIGFLMLAICHNPCGVQIAQILMLSLPLPIHLLDRLLDFGVTFSLGLLN